MQAAHGAVVHHDLCHLCLLDERNARCPPHRVHQHAHHLGAGGIRRVHDPPPLMGGFQSEFTRELRTLQDQKINCPGRLFDNPRHRLAVAKSGAGGDRIRRVQRCRIIVADGCSDAALRP
jgi:hypothetical protein